MPSTLLPSPTATALVPAIDSPGNTERRQMVLLAAAAGGHAAAGVAIPLVSSLAPSERARALGASVEVDIGDLPPGGLATVEWRGKPVWILRRTPDMLAALPRLDPALADPTSQKDQQPAYARNPARSIRPELLVAVGICTHLGCSPSTVPAGTDHPSVGPDWQGGFFCPCHGSTFDLAGRVFKNKPAPVNLEVPPHHYVSDTRLRIGEDSA